MRIALPAFALLLLCACTPPAPQAADAPAPPATPEAAGASGASAVLSAAPVSGGAWILRGDGADVSAGYGYPESEYVLTIRCHGGADRVTFFWQHDLLPPQDTTLRLITATQTVEIPARSALEGYVEAEIDGADPRLDALKDAQERFAIEVAGQADVFVWDQSIKDTLTQCGA